MQQRFRDLQVCGGSPSFDRHAQVPSPSVASSASSDGVAPAVAWPSQGTLDCVPRFTGFLLDQILEQLKLGSSISICRLQGGDAHQHSPGTLLEPVRISSRCHSWITSHGAFWIPSGSTKSSLGTFPGSHLGSNKYELLKSNCLYVSF